MRSRIYYYVAAPIFAEPQAALANRRKGFAQL